MEIENKTKKSNIRDVANFQVPKQSLEHLGKYCTSKGYKKTETFAEISEYLYRTNMPLSVFLNDKYELHQMNQAIIKNHAETTSVLKKFENSFQGKIETNNTNNLDFLNKVLTLILEFESKESIESVISAQNFKLLRSLISVDIEDKDAETLLRETLHAVEVAKKTLSSKKIPELQKAAEPEKEKPKTNTKEYLTLVGLVSKKPLISTIPGGKNIYCRFSLIEKSAASQDKVWENVVMWEASLTKNLGLTSKKSIEEYFLKINKGDLLKMNGFSEDRSYTDKEGKEFTQLTLIVTEILEHASASTKEMSKENK